MLIGLELSSIRMYRPWKWYDGGGNCFSFSRPAIFRETSTEMDVKTLKNTIVKDKIGNNFPWSLLLSTIGLDIKKFKTLPWNHSHVYDSWFYLSFEHLTSFLRLIRVETSRVQAMENCCRCRFFPQLQDDTPPPPAPLDDNDQGGNEGFCDRGGLEI